jgi:hypothetical protein
MMTQLKIQHCQEKHRCEEIDKLNAEIERLKKDRAWSWMEIRELRTALRWVLSDSVDKRLREIAIVALRFDATQFEECRLERSNAAKEE